MSINMGAIELQHGAIYQDLFCSLYNCMMSEIKMVDRLIY